MFPMNRCGPEGKVKEGVVKDLSHFLPLPSLGDEGGLVWFGPYCRRSVGCESPRGAGEANQRLLEHGVQKGQSATHRPLISLMSQSKPIPFDPHRWGDLCICYRSKVYLGEKPMLVTEKNSACPARKMQTVFSLEGANDL